GMRTLPMRVRHASASALFLAAHLERLPQVTAVLYPGLASHRQHAVAKRQMRGGFGGMLSIRVKGGDAGAIARAGHGEPWAQAPPVLYPGLASPRQHAVAKRQMRGGFGGMLSIRVKGGEAAAIARAAQVKLWKRATSLGGVESLIEHRASIEGAGSPVPGDLL